MSLLIQCMDLDRKPIWSGLSAVSYITRYGRETSPYITEANQVAAMGPWREEVQPGWREPVQGIPSPQALQYWQRLWVINLRIMGTYWVLLSPVVRGMVVLISTTRGPHINLIYGIIDHFVQPWSLTFCFFIYPFGPRICRGDSYLGSWGAEKPHCHMTEQE